MRPNYPDAYKPATRWDRFVGNYKLGGAWSALSSSAKTYWKVASRNWLHVWFNARPARTFQYCGETYTYLAHKSNTTWANERAVEIPIVKRLLERSAGRRVLEVGRVLSHYGPVSHDVPDKYEEAPGVILEDVVSFRPAVKYDLIVSISTLEHVGYDEDTQDPTKILDAIDNLVQNCLTGTGRFVFTIPVGYNPALDRFIDEGRLPLDAMRCLLRTDPRTWRESSWEEARRCPFDSETPSANAIVVGHVQAERAPGCQRT